MDNEDLLQILAESRLREVRALKALDDVKEHCRELWLKLVEFIRKERDHIAALEERNRQLEAVRPDEALSRTVSELRAKLYRMEARLAESRA